MVYYVDTECMPRVVYWRGVRISRSGKQIMRRATTAAAATLASTPHPCLGVDFFSVTYCNTGGAVTFVSTRLYLYVDMDDPTHSTEERFAATFLDAGPATAHALEEPRDRHERRIQRAKLKEYPRRAPEAWTQAGYAHSGVVEELRCSVPESLERVDADAISEADFADTYERGSKPVIVRGLTGEWPAVRDGRWSLEALLLEHGQDRFKVGEDDDGYAVYVKLKHFARYCLETKDDSPLYVFDSSFAEREATRSLRHDWALPKFFTDDLFKLVGERRRPPYRWLVLGPARSGSYIHIDPLGTSAWNALLAGAKLWALFPPSTPKGVVQPPGHAGGREAIAWFTHVYPQLVDAADPAHRPLAGIQWPGETMFVPGGWWHVVLNLELSIAVTQNFCSRANFDAVWAKTRKSRRKMSIKLQQALKTHHPQLYEHTLSAPDLAAEGDHSSSDSSSSSSYSTSDAGRSDEDDEDDAARRRRRDGNGDEKRRDRSRSRSRARARGEAEEGEQADSDWRSRARARAEDEEADGPA